MKEKILRLCPLLAFVLLICGCAATPKALPIRTPPSGADVPPIHSTKVVLASGAYKDMAIGVFSLGAISDSKIKVLEEKVNNTLVAINRSSTARTSSPVKVRVIVRHFLHAYTNMAGCMFACVAWCLADHTNAVLFEDQFYAKAEGHLVILPPTVRKWLYDRITERICLTTVQFYQTGGMAAESSPVEVGGTYATMDQAVKHLPSYLLVGTLSIPLPTGVNWRVAEPTRKVKWDDLLKE